jgi:5-methyltetrahydrofolate--homocysteine methyltransferase
VINAPDWENAKKRYRRWWSGDCDGPIIQLQYRNPDQPEERPRPAWAKNPDGWWSLMDWLSGPGRSANADPGECLDYLEYQLAQSVYYRDAYPSLWLNLGPGVLAAYLTGYLKYETSTSWFELPEPMAWDAILNLKLDPANPWLVRTRKMARAMADRGKGRYIVGMTDIGGPLDVLASLRTGQQLLEDCVTDPALVRLACEMILGYWHQVYNELDGDIRSRGQDGTSAWMGIWSPGTSYPLQCDFCAMIGPAMFEKLVRPDVAAQCDRLENTIFHWDGPGELPHLDHLLSIKALLGIQWVPGASAPDAAHDDWIPYYKRIQKAGKRLVLNNALPAGRTVEVARRLNLQGLLINPWCGSEKEARDMERALLHQGG